MKFDYNEIIEEVKSQHFWSRLVIMIFAVFLLAITYNTLLLPYELVTGGTSGIAIIINHFFDIPPAMIIFILEIILLILSFILLGTKKTSMTIIGALLFPFFISITENSCQIITNLVKFDNYIIISLISGILFGIGSGVVYKMGYSTGGGDIIMQILNKYLNISTGTASFITNIIIIFIGAFVFGINKAIYGTIIVIIISILVDKIMLGISTTKMFYIQTKKID